MDKVINIKNIIKSQAADDNCKGNKVFESIKESCDDSNEKRTIILDFDGIELVNTAFLNNAIGKLFDRKEFNLLENSVKVKNMNSFMIELLKESISLAREKYT